MLVCAAAMEEVGRIEHDGASRHRHRHARLAVTILATVGCRLHLERALLRDGVDKRDLDRDVTDVTDVTEDTM